VSSQLVAAFLSTAQPWIVEVTGYCPCGICCGRWADGITACGAKAEGRFVAAPREIPFGTLVYIPGYAKAPVPVLDRGGAIKGNKLDLFFATHTEAARWGRRMMTVWIASREPSENLATSAVHPRQATARLEPARRQVRRTLRGYPLWDDMLPSPPRTAHDDTAALLDLARQLHDSSIDDLMREAERWTQSFDRE